MTDLSEQLQPTLEGGIRRKPAPQLGARKDEASPLPAYYDIPMLKPSLWKWEISSYFFFGGLSGGAFLISRMADRFGGENGRAVTRAGTAIALAALLPCPPLLIADLGDPTRFHYMLRVFKPKSPMNLGAWIISAFGGVVALAALKEWLASRRRSRPSKAVRAADTVVDAIADLLGIPLALGLAGYTGVLLSTSATPIWARNRWIGPLFSASAISTGASAISLWLSAGKSRGGRRAMKPLHKVSSVARLAEAAALGGFLAEAGSLAKPVTEGKYAPHMWGGAAGAGLVLSTILEIMPAPSEKSRRWLHIAGAAAGLAGGLALRWAITQAGRPSGGNPQAAREVSRDRQ
jgi:formate-dependent nitrite reductase membrane component NrfD